MTDDAPKTPSPSAARPPRRNTKWLALGGVVLVWGGLRTCYCDTYKIPASSMMPTLHVGDHIYTSKIAYGWKIPGTDVAIGGMSLPARGDVIVFRYPVNPREDFIKRVIGLPGDEVRVQGRELAIKRAGDAEFEEVAREPLAEGCEGESGNVEKNCTVFTETIDGRSYEVEYISGREPADDLPLRAHTLVVPDGHLFVLGDNRNRSHDSLAWTDPHTDEPRPFVPLEYVRGRAERIWLPTGRFWQRIR